MRLPAAMADDGATEDGYQTPSWIEVPPVAEPEDADIEYEEELGYPGEPPYTRGAYASMYRGRLWTMRQYAGFGSPEETNERFHQLLDQGMTGLSVAFDLPTQIGYDSDAEIAMGEVGKVGVAIDSIRDMETLFDSIPLDEVSTSMTINAPAAVLLAMYIVAAERQGVDESELRGTVQNDILKEYIARGTYIYPPDESLRLTADMIEYCSENVPKWNTISISGYHIREAGASAPQELAFTLANARAYVKRVLDRGMDVDSFAPRLSFFFNGYSDLFEEVAKFRAARRMWSTIMEEEFDAEHPKSKRLRFHTQTAGSSLTAQQPLNNVVRTTIEALAAVLGGTQSLHTNAWDEALGLPTERSARVALRTQQILAHESGVANTIDPLAGSYHVEWMTDEIEERTWELLHRIDDMGGMQRAIEQGWVQEKIQDAAWRHQQEVEEGERTIVGVNAFELEDEEDQEVLEIPDDLEEHQIDRLQTFKADRDEEAAQAAIADLEEAAEGTENLMPHILDAVRQEATTGEICNALRRTWGEYRDPAGGM
jgi:methylmalonyl-CoA mutase N-terminal domain/subunit